ncbi:hypothetical protein AAG570_005538 [Ranatra chinensis]|uniref:Uncharacterized protein n=1 Tax=Ranatra chinensis TaxID=642074 RepID=A0ABD0YAK2_9HEMI
MLGSGVTGVVALCAALVVCASGRDYEKTGVNVRTVLFSAKDLCKSCWSAEDAELLKARMVLQDIIPTRLTTDFPMVLRYLRICLETLNSEVPQIKLKVSSKLLSFYNDEVMHHNP